MRRGFASHELLFRIAALAVVIALCLPILERASSGRMSPALAIALVGVICLVAAAPWLYSEWSYRRWEKGRETRRDEDEG